MIKSIRDDLINCFVAMFNDRKKADELMAESEGRAFVFDEDYIDKAVAFVCGCQKGEDLFVETKKKIVSSYDFLQAEGEALLSDYSHTDWYPDYSQERKYWERYFNWLKSKNPEFGNKESKFDSNTDAITNLLGNPASPDPFAVRGLVMGDVQSGKTGTYIGVICKAVDAGYRVIILLTGLTESLRKQTQKRIDEGFVGFDSYKQNAVGVGRNSKLLMPRSMTSTYTDYKGSADQNTAPAVSRKDSVPLIFVCKKNVSILRKLISGLRNLNTSETRTKIDVPLLLIDDEADNASVNTNKADYDPTEINHQITALLALFRQSSYVGFTATPFANVFIQPTSADDMGKDNLFPRDFIYSLNAPNTYIGPAKLFCKNGCLRSAVIDLNDAEANQNLFSYQHKKDWDGDRLFPSFYESIITFCLSNAIRDLRGDSTSHRSMLINMSRFIDVQKKIAGIAQEYFDEIKRDVKLFGKQNDNTALSNPNLAQIHQVWTKQFENKVEFSWKDVKSVLYQAIKNIKIAIVNSKSAKSIDYEANKKDGLRVIAVGGLALSRGLTLEGLMTSYFFRNTSTYDVLMQMGRWFGYRPHYEDLIRIWIPAVSAEWYGEIAEAIELMRKDIVTMIEKKKTPLEFGIRVRNDSDELGITAPNKMRNTIDRVERFSFYGGVFENTFVTNNFDENESNWDCVDRLSVMLPNPDESVKKPYYRGVPVSVVLDLLEKIRVPRVSVQFDREQLINFIKKTEDKKLSTWDVLIASKEIDDGGQDNGLGLRKPKPVTLKNGLRIYPIERTCLEREYAVAVSGGRSHIGSRDTKYGLTQEQIKKIEDERNQNGQEGTSQKLYMIPDRNPLLIIYPIFPKPDSSTYGKNVARENFRLNLKNLGGRGCFVAFSVAIPRSNSQQNNEAHLYVVNRNADYYARNAYSEEEGDEI